MEITRGNPFGKIDGYVKASQQGEDQDPVPCRIINVPVKHNLQRTVLSCPHRPRECRKR